MCRKTMCELPLPINYSSICERKMLCENAHTSSIFHIMCTHKRSLMCAYENKKLSWSWWRTSLVPRQEKQVFRFAVLTWLRVQLLSLTVVQSQRNQEVLSDRRWNDTPLLAFLICWWFVGAPTAHPLERRRIDWFNLTHVHTSSL